MRRIGQAIVGVALLAVPSATVDAGTDLVLFPEDFQTSFVRYQVVDRPDRKISRFMYMDAASWQAARSGAPLPSGAIIVMEDHPVRMADADTPVLDSQGRLIPTDETTNVFVMEKRPGWGDEYPPEIRNGEWEYAWFAPDGARSEKPMTRCFECHKAQEAEDFTFTAFKAVQEQK